MPVITRSQRSNTNTATTALVPTTALAPTLTIPVLETAMDQLEEAKNEALTIVETEIANLLFQRKMFPFKTTILKMLEEINLANKKKDLFLKNHPWRYDEYLEMYFDNYRRATELIVYATEYLPDIYEFACKTSGNFKNIILKFTRVVYFKCIELFFQIVNTETTPVTPEQFRVRKVAIETFMECMEVLAKILNIDASKPFYKVFKRETRNNSPNYVLEENEEVEDEKDEDFEVEEDEDEDEEMVYDFDDIEWFLNGCQDELELDEDDDEEDEEDEEDDDEPYWKKILEREEPSIKLRVGNHTWFN